MATAAGGRRRGALLRVHVRNADLVVVGDRPLMFSMEIAGFAGQQIAQCILGERQRFLAVVFE
jgi:hypothetical protein